jgi:hypothetical protein
MKALPFNYILYEGAGVPHKSETMCKETGGDCLKFV